MMSSNSHRHSSPPEDRDGPTRKRVGKACDRCRLKKSKCNGLGPCSRCQADNAICVFGERRRVQDRVYPKGYVEMLEQQQAQLVAAIRQLYSRLQPDSEATGWPGEPLPLEPNGAPLTHSILDRLDLLYLRIEGGPIPDGSFEEDPENLRQKMLSSQGLPQSPFDSDSAQTHDSTSSPSHSGSESRISPIFSSFSADDKAPLKPVVQKGRPGRPRLNKNKPSIPPISQTDGVATHRRRHSTKDPKQVKQEQRTLSTGFQLAMEQMPQINTGNTFIPFTQPNFAGSSVPMMAPLSSSFNAADNSPPISPSHIGPFASPQQLDAKPVGLTALATSQPLPVTIGSTPPALAPSRSQFGHGHGHGHGNSVSSISSIDSTLGDADPLFDLGDASLDNTVSLFDPFVAGEPAVLSNEGDPLAALSSLVSEPNSCAPGSTQPPSQILGMVTAGMN